MDEQVGLPWAKVPESPDAPKYPLVGHRLIVLRMIKARGDRGSTCEEAEHALGMLHQSCSARIKELHDMGVIYVDGSRLTVSGRAARVYKAAKPPEGQDAKPG